MTINYEYVRGLQRKERNVANVVELDDTFYSELAGYVKESTDAHNPSKSPDAFREFENTMHISRDFFDRREQKILFRALNNTRTGETDDSHLTPEEKVLYGELCSILSAHRLFFSKVLLGEYVSSVVSVHTDERETLIKEGSPNITLVRVRKDVPRFVGSDSNEYGPFEVGDVVKLPKKEAEFMSQQSIIEIL
jgi:DNA replication initiation complex subunit (GINS family)